MLRSSLRKDVRVRYLSFLILIDLQVTRFMTEQDAIAAIEALEAQNAAKAREVQMAAAMAADKTVVSDTDTTFTGNVTASSSKLSSAPKKKGTKAKLTAKEKKERSVSFFA
jgi:DASH complex subunit DAM1